MGVGGQTTTTTKMADRILVVMLKHTGQKPINAMETATACNRHWPKLSDPSVDTC